MIGDKVKIIVDDESKGCIGEIIKIDHNMGIYGIRMLHQGDNAALWWFDRDGFEVIE